jgi:hypothetical protein
VLLTGGSKVRMILAGPWSLGVPAYLRGAAPWRSKLKTFEPGPTSRIRLLVVLYWSGITDTSSSTTSDGMVGFLTFLLIVMVLRISTRYLPGRSPRLISYFPSLLMPPPPPGPWVPSIGIHAIDPVVSGLLSSRTMPVTVGSDSQRIQRISATHTRTSNPPAAGQTHRAFLTVESPCHDGATRNEGVQPSCYSETISPPEIAPIACHVLRLMFWETK